MFTINIRISQRFKKIRKRMSMNFGQALEALKNGSKLARSGWNGKNMFIYYVPEGFTELNGISVKCDPYIAMLTAQNTVVPWLASQTDLLTDDWSIA
jgi:hypothetical protein